MCGFPFVYPPKLSQEAFTPTEKTRPHGAQAVKDEGMPTFKNPLPGQVFLIAGLAMGLGKA